MGYVSATKIRMKVEDEESFAACLEFYSKIVVLSFFLSKAQVTSKP